MRQKAGKRINGSALESIMQDVLQGIEDFTSDACINSIAADMEIIAVEKPAREDAVSAEVIPFPSRQEDQA